MTAAVGTNQYGLDAEFYTRGSTVEKDRGESMVHKHMEKMQQDRENLALQKLGALMPQMGLPVRILALKEAEFDVETAVSMLKAFQTQNEQVSQILKKRKKLQTAEEEAVKKAEEEQQAAERAAEKAASSSSDSSGSDSSDDSDSGSSSGDDRRKRKRSSKKRSKRSSKDSKKRKKRSGKDRDSDSDRKKRRKDKDRKAQPGPTNVENFGRFGLIRESDMHAKHAEFTLWAIEVKKVNPELLNKAEERELFRDYMEDFNTGTLKHRKYYNLEIYEREKKAKYAAKYGAKAEKLSKKQQALNDEAALRREREAERARLEQERRERDLAELRMTGKAKDMREQELLRLQMQAAYKTGDRAKAEQIAKQLMTDDEKMAKGIIKWKPKI